MLERSVVLHSESLQTLTAIIFTLTVLLRPFVYQAVLLPILPPSLLELLQAPVAFLVGVHSSCLQVALQQLAENPNNDVIVVSIDTCKISDRSLKSIQVPRIPCVRHFSKTTLSPLFSSLRHRHNIVDNNNVSGICGEIAKCWIGFWEGLFADFRKHCFRDM
jgi:hypothetical protein